MTENKLRIARNLALIFILALLLLAGSLPAAQAIWAAPANTTTLNATQDTYTDINLAATNLNEGLLTAANSPGSLDEADVTTKQIFVEFDLGSVDFEIKSATLRLSTLTCGGLVPVDVADVTIYGVDNGSTWDESTLTWEGQPDASTNALVHLDAGQTTFDTAQTYTWTDSNMGDFVTWLETQRNAGNGSVTLILIIENTDGPGMADIFFEDSEGSGAAYGCTDSLGGPTLKLSSIISGLNIFLPLINR